MPDIACPFTLATERAMSWEMAVVFLVVAVALGLFISERWPIDQVALAIPVVLLASGILTPQEAIAGFSNPATVTVAAMLALSVGLVKTGAVAGLANWAHQARFGGPRRRLFAICALVAAVSPFLNNTAVVVVLLPVFLSMAREDQRPASLYLIPLSFAAMLGGTVSLIGTSTNLIVYGMARTRGFDELTMFSIAPLGLVYLAAGFLYLFTVGRRLLPRREPPTRISVTEHVREYVAELVVTRRSPAVGQTLGDLRWGELYGVRVLGLDRGGRTLWRYGPQRRLLLADIVIVEGGSQDILALAKEQGLEPPPRPDPATAPATEPSPAVRLDAEDARQVEVLVAPTSTLVGRTLDEERFQQRHDATVLALHHHARPTRNRIHRLRVQAGDLLLVHGRPPALAGLFESPGFEPVTLIQPPPVERPRALVAVGILIWVVALAGLGVVEILGAALMGVVVMLFSRCVTLQEMYDEMDWMVVFLLAGAIPLGTAMEKTGAAQWLAMELARHLGEVGPVAVVAGFYTLTVVLTSVMSNNATAIILTPIAILTANDLGMNPYALLVAVMFGASAAFLTPVGYQTNTMVYGPGGYRFVDVLKVGAPLNLLLLVVASLLIPHFWPS